MHQGPQVGARVHPLDGPVAQISRGVSDCGHRVPYLVGTAKDIVTVDERLGPECDYPVHRVDECHRAADLVPAQGVQIWHMTEERPHQVTDEGGPVLRHPDDKGVGGLTARGGVKLEPAACELERMAVDERGGERWFRR